MTTLSKDEVVRHISQVFCLERLAASDIPMARSLLSALVQVCLLSDSHCTGPPEWPCYVAQPLARSLLSAMCKLDCCNLCAPCKVGQEDAHVPACLWRVRNDRQ